MCWRASLVVSLGVIGIPAFASAQAVERHVAPGERQGVPEAPLPMPSQTPVVNDDRILAPALTGLVLIGQSGGEAAWPKTAAVEDQSGGVREFAKLERLLRPFIGRPLTPKLISQIQGVIVAHYRQLNHPFVAVAPPPQEVGHGVLRLRVVEFKLGRKTVKAKDDALGYEQGYIIGRTRVQTGEFIDAKALSEDLDWLGRYPYREITADFSPSQTVGATDMTLTDTRQKPWTVFGDYSNSGAPSTGVDRYSLGTQVALGLPRDSLFSYQLTGSRNAFAASGKPFPLGNADYVGHSAVFVTSLAPRQELSINLGFITSVSPSQDFFIRSATTEVSATYRFALSNLWSPLAGDLSTGVELRRQLRGTLYSGARVAEADVDVAQGVLGYALTFGDPGWRQSVTVTAHYSPGDADKNNSDLALARFSNGRVSHSSYVYETFDYSLAAPLGGGWVYQTGLDAQSASRTLSSTESFLLGGEGAVRGYTLDDGAFDEGYAWRNTLRLPSASGAFGRISAAAAPYLFLDRGRAWDLNHVKLAAASSTGLGLDTQIGPNLSGGALVAAALRDGPETHSGVIRFMAHLGVRF